MNRKIVMSINTAWNIYNFRSGLIRTLVNQGYDVITAAPRDEYAVRLKDFGCRFVSMPMDNNGMHPGRDLSLLMRYFLLLRAERPLAYLGYTVKPNVYGSLAAHSLGIPVINNIAGLGTAFIHKTLLTHVVSVLYKLSLRRSHRVFFQNADDEALFIGTGLVRPGAAERLPGSGMDLVRYSAAPANGADQPFRFLLIARMLRDKGVIEFVEAARIVLARFPAIRFQLLGFVDAGNSNSISLEQIRDWERQGLVNYLGKTDDVRPYLADADCIVLPSYREGVPRTLLEAAAAARPIIATNAIGCRDVVDDRVNGLLCRIRDPVDLAEKMMQMIGFTPEQRMQMGRAGRRKVEEQFDERLVIQKYIDTLDGIAATRPDRRTDATAARL